MEEGLKPIVDALPFIVPIIIVELALMVIALVDLLRRDYVAGGNKLIWALVIIFINLIGPIVYLIFGRKEKPIDSD